MTSRTLVPALLLAAMLPGCPGEDVTRPAVTIITPTSGDTLLGTVTVRALATDDHGVRLVQFLVDSTVLGADSVPDGDTFSLDWNTSDLGPGTTHVLTCVAVDQADNRSSPAEVSVVVSLLSGTRHHGPITANQNWAAADNPHVVDGDLVVEARLTLEPGVRVFVADGVSIAAGSRYPAALVCRGTADSTIVISGLRQSPGAWQGIELLQHCTAESTVFEYCTVEYGGGSARGLITSDGARPRITHCLLRHSAGAGVAATRLGFASFSANAVYNCAGFPVTVDASGVPDIGPDNNFAGNALHGIGVSGGRVTEPAEWPNRLLPYCLTATVTVAGAASPLLTIAAGCSLLFADSARLRVGVGEPGGLRADGTYGPITFAALSSAPVPGSWRGIEFWELTDAARSVLSFCRISHAGSAGSAAVMCYSASLAFVGCRISASAGDGLGCTNCGFVRFEYDTITGCAGYPLSMAAPFVGSLGVGNSFAGNGRDSIPVAGGAITRNALWRRSDVPFVIEGTVEVGASAAPALVIEPGCRLAFGPDAGLAIGRGEPGMLTAVGLPDSIVFTGTRAAPGSWRGVELHSNADNRSRLERCRLLYGGGAGTGILFVDSCLPVIRGNELGWSGSYCAYLWNTDLNPDSLLALNWLHDPAPGYDTVFDGGRRR